MDEARISRGFRSRRQEQTPKNRLPPGQYVTTDFPVLSAGPTPQIKVENWTLALQLGGSLLGKWNWAEFEALPQTTTKTDIHCVTKWSKLDTTWQGVTFADLLKAVGLAKPPAAYVMAHSDGAYTTNIPVADLVGGQGMIATRYEGLPIPPAHGGPAGCLCRIFTFGKAPNGCGDCALWRRRNVVSGSRWVITITATPGTPHDGPAPYCIRSASNKVIARRLGISLHTAKFHVAAIFAKLDADSRTEARSRGPPILVW